VGRSRVKGTKDRHERYRVIGGEEQVIIDFSNSKMIVNST